MITTRRGFVAASLGVASAPGWAICISARQSVQHLKILRAQLEETGKADPRLWGDLRASLSEMKGWLAQRRQAYARDTQGLKRVRELEARLRRIEQGIGRLRQTSDSKAAVRQIAGLLQQLDDYGRGTERLP